MFAHYPIHETVARDDHVGVGAVDQASTPGGVSRLAAVVVGDAHEFDIAKALVNEFLTVSSSKGVRSAEPSQGLANTLSILISSSISKKPCSTHCSTYITSPASTSLVSSRTRIFPDPEVI